MDLNRYDEMHRHRHNGGCGVYWTLAWHLITSLLSCLAILTTRYPSCSDVYMSPNKIENDISIAQ